MPAPHRPRSSAPSHRFDTHPGGDNRRIAIGELLLGVRDLALDAGLEPTAS